MLWPSQSLDPNPTEHLSEILDKQHSPPPALKHQMRDYLMEDVLQY